MDTEQLTIMDVLEQSTEPRRPEFETFWMSQLGYCTRQLYLSHLGLTDTSDGRGRLNASRLIQDHLEQQVADNCPHVDVAPKVRHAVDDLCFVGQPTAYDPSSETVYHIKPRNGWYKYHPPNERHLDQIQAYIQALDADRGRLIYVSMADFTDTRTWPPEPDEFVDRDDQRFERVVDRAQTVVDEIVANGIAQVPSEIPFYKCDCFLCEKESLMINGGRHLTGSIEGSSSSPDSTSTTAVADGGCTPDYETMLTQLEGCETQPLITDGYHVPSELRDLDLWVVWDTKAKVALAPWQSGTMYPVQWAEESGNDPRRPFEKAQMVSEMPVGRIDEHWPFPRETDLPETIRPAILLEHEPGENPITLLDLDMVRDPKTKTTSQEVVDLLDRLEGYAELSQSGTGLHVFVKGGLPEGYSMASGALDDVGRIEIYDHSRFVGCTWHHVENTPLNSVPERADEIAELVDAHCVSPD